MTFSEVTSPIGPIVVSTVALVVPVLAQIESISGGAGWAGAGLLGLVLAWLLLVHLPAQDKKQQALIEAKDKAVEIKDKAIEKIVNDFKTEAKDLRQAHKEILDKVCAEFREQIKDERDSCRRDDA